MKAKWELEYCPETEMDTVKTYMQAIDWYCVVNTIDQHLRNKIKYEDLSEDVLEVLEEVRDKLWAELRDRDLQM